MTDRIFLESKREEDRQKAAASSGAVDGYADREGVEIVAKAFFKDRQLRAMSGQNQDHYTLSQVWE